MLACSSAMMESRLIEEDQGACSGVVCIARGAGSFDSNCSFGGPTGEKSRLAYPTSVVPILDTLPRILMLLRSRRCVSFIRLAGRLDSSWRVMVATRGMVSRRSRVD